MATKNFSAEELLGEKVFSKTLSLCITKGKLSEHDIKVNYRDFKDSEYWKTPKHIHWIFDIMVKKEHKPELIKELMRFLLRKWNSLESGFCSNKLKQLHERKINLEILFDEIKQDLSAFEKLNENGYFPINFLVLFGYLMIIQEKNNRKDAYMFKNMLEAVLSDEYNPYKIVSIATGRYSKK